MASLGEQVGVEQGPGVEDFQAHYLSVLPVHDDHRLHTGRRATGDAVPPGRQWLLSEVDVGRVAPGVVADLHRLRVKRGRIGGSEVWVELLGFIDREPPSLIGTTRGG